MKHQPYSLYFVVAFTLIFVPKVNAQEPNPPCQLHLQSDKTIYVSGESIGFKCVLTPSDQQNNAILFVDICSEETLITSSLLNAENNQWNGDIYIPDSLQTGVYLLRAYIGNKQGNPLITSQLVSVLNRFGENEQNETRKGDQNNRPLNQLNYLAATDALLQTYAKTAHCPPGDTLQFWIENKTKASNGGISFAVFKLDKLAKKEEISPSSSWTYTQSDEIKIFEDYTIRGIIKNKSDNVSVSDKIVYCSIPDSIAQISYDFTDTQGTFSFNLNSYSANEAVIIQTDDKSVPYTIHLYPSQLLPPEKIPFYIPVEIENSELAQLAIQRATLHKAYYHEAQKEVFESKMKFPFYGIAQSRVNTDKYIALNDFKEIAWEILPLVKYRQTKDSTYLKVLDPELNVFFSNPLILVDGVPGSSPASLNSLNSKSINWIDIQPQIRCYGNMLFEGLINIQTKKGDFSDIEMPFNAIEYDLDTFSEPNRKKQTKPLFRDVLFWEPYIDPNQRVNQINVACSYETGTYIAVAQLYDSKGALHRSVFQFEVKDEKEPN